LCFDAATEGATGGRLVCRPPVVVAKQRPRQSRRPSAAKSIIRVEVPKDTGPIYLQASFFRAAATPVGGFSLLTVLVYVADEHPAFEAGTQTL
jgi:hypothetical protein